MGHGQLRPPDHLRTIKTVKDMMRWAADRACLRDSASLAVAQGSVRACMGARQVNTVAAAITALALLSATPALGAPHWSKVSEDTVVRTSAEPCYAWLDGKVVADCRRVMMTKVSDSIAMVLDPLIDDPTAQMNASQVQVVTDRDGIVEWVTVDGQVDDEASGTCSIESGAMSCMARLKSGKHFQTGEHLR